jgi:hypothetical protein
MIGIGRTARNVFGLANVRRAAPVLQHGDMVFNCGKLVSYISHHMALKPGTSALPAPARVSSRLSQRQTGVAETGRQGIDVTIEKLGKPTFTLNLR